VVVRLYQPMLGSIDRWRTAQEDTPTRAEAMRRLIERALKDIHRSGAQS
jgi:hypothetical protein